MKKSLLIPVLAALCAVPAFAEKIGVVDADRIRKEYTKSQENAKRLQDMVADAKKDLAAREAAVIKLRSEAEAVAKDAESPTLNDAARAAKKSELQTKGQAFLKARDELNLMQQQIAGNVQQRDVQFQQDLIREIREKAAVVAKEKSLDLVLPSGATLYAADSLDVTGDVLKKLNEAYAANPVSPSEPAKTAPAAK